MKRTSPFGLAAKSTLRVTDRPEQTDKQIRHTLQGGHDLRKQLNNIPHKNTNTYLPKTATFSKTQQISAKRSEEEALALEVAALDNFRVPVQNEKTRNLVENIKLRRRQKHLDLLEMFREDLEDYRENMVSVYQSLGNDTSQVLSIRQSQLRQYLESLSDDYLLSREREVLEEIAHEVSESQHTSEAKVSSALEELERLKQDREGLVADKCQFLGAGLTDIAFVLEAEANQIANKERSQMQQQENTHYSSTKEKISSLGEKQTTLYEELSNDAKQLQDKWRELHENKAIDDYLSDADQKEYRWPEQRVRLYASLVELQNANSDRKHRLISNLAREHPDSLSKANIDRWLEHLKTINESFNDAFDGLIKVFMQEQQESTAFNNDRYEHLRDRLQYVGRRQIQEIQQLLKQKCEPKLQRNNNDCKNLLKDVTNYVEETEQRQTSAFEKLGQFVGQLGTRCDEFLRKWGALSQEYEVSKAQILDEDDETVEKLNNELNDLKQQLRQALHHIKLEEVQEQCFKKIDQLQQAYRNTHQRNKDLSSTRPATIDTFMDQFEASIAQAFSLYEQSKMAQLQEMATKQCEEKALKQIEEEEKKKQEQEAEAAQEIKKKGGKPPPAAKPKDPKKAAAQLQERKKVVMQQIGLRKIEEVKTTGGTWLAYKSLEETSIEFYSKEEGTSGDAPSEAIVNFEGTQLVSKQALISASLIASQLVVLRDGLFSGLGQKRQRIHGQSSDLDSIFLDESLEKLDERMRAHYPLKGRVETEIGVVRSGQVTGHKKQYEKYVRTVKDRVDLQTQKFNYLLQKALELIKKHNSDQKAIKQKLTTGKTLSDYQSCNMKAHDNYKNFLRETNEIGKELTRLGTAEVDTVLKSNEDFLKRAKTMADGGEFSASEIEWYTKMMTEVNEQITQQRQKRVEKTKQVQEHVEKRSKELIEMFEKDYANAIEQLAAKDGTGKKYGKPKRVAQEKIRLEMNKCQKSQISIDNQLDLLASLTSSAIDPYPNKPQILEWRAQLITLQSCIIRYAKHIEAMVSPLVARALPRFTLQEGSSDALLSPAEEQEDKKRQENELKKLGPLGEQKEDKPFMKFVEDIEKIIGDEARNIYTGQKAKYITGNDKIPDFLRLYIHNMRKSAEQFRQESVRGLRTSCKRLSQLIAAVTSHFFGGLRAFYGGKQKQKFTQRRQELEAFIRENQRVRTQNLKKLRPNLANPKNQDELKQLDEEEKQRQQKEAQTIKQTGKVFEDEHFENAEKFLNATLSHYEMLILFADSLYLPEDFAKVAGDEEQQKVHLDAKRLLLMQQKGITINANSERNIKKKWDGANCTVFNFGDKVYQAVAAAPAAVDPKDKKGAKKDSKNAKVEDQPASSNETSKVIETVKTWRQKGVFTAREQLLNSMKAQYEEMLAKMKESVEKGLADNESFRLKWRSIAEPLYVK